MEVVAVVGWLRSVPGGGGVVRTGPVASASRTRAVGALRLSGSVASSSRLVSVRPAAGSEAAELPQLAEAA